MTKAGCILIAVIFFVIYESVMGVLRADDLRAVFGITNRPAKQKIRKSL